MSFHSWLQNLRSAVTPGRSQGRQRQRRSPRAATHRPSVEVLEDRLTPSFSPATSFPVGPNLQTVVTGDFNNDGRLDLAVANHDDGTVGVLLGDGHGGFGVAITTMPATPAITTIDRPRSRFDGDGHLDLVVASVGRATMTTGAANLPVRQRRWHLPGHRRRIDIADFRVA